MTRMKSRILALAVASLPAADSISAWAQDASAQAVSYCSDLERVVELAMSKERFASIAGSLRQGNFVDTKLALTGWKDCALYGQTTYTCDSTELASATDAERAQVEFLEQMKTCLGEGWSEAPDLSSASHVILHHSLRPITITLSMDQTDDRKHVVRLTLFIRVRPAR
jgi:hypothetical protein